MPIYDEIADNISTDEGQCVLVLGPELSVNKKGEYYKSFFNALKAKNPDNILDYLPKENIFVFRDRSGSDEMFGDIEGFYKNVGDDTLLELIARIKFPLIINVCPDKSINKVYRKNNIPFIYGYFCKSTQQDGEQATKYILDSAPDDPQKKILRPEPLTNIPRPTREIPVVYNIFGDCDVSVSMIYNHETFYDAMEALMSAGAIPGKITDFINRANCIIFLGFDFDSWHYQLILHKMGLGKAAKKKNYGSLRGERLEAKVNVVIKEYFKVRFVEENPTNTIEQIIETLKTKDEYKISLRQPTQSKNYSVYISYAWKDKEADVLGFINRVKNAVNLAKDEKIKHVEELINKSGKMLPANEDLEWIYSHNQNDKGQTLEEWYHSLPCTEKYEAKKLLYDREDVVVNLENKLKEKGIIVFRDKNEMTYGDSIDSFMNRIGTGKAVIRVVSDKYLKSRYCMDEALRINRNPDKDKRVFTIVLRDDIDIDFQSNGQQPELNDGDSIRYKKYWQSLVEDIYGKLDSGISGLFEKEREKRSYYIYIEIYDYIMKFIREIRDELHAEMAGTLPVISIEQTKPFEQQLNQFNGFVETVINKLKN